MICMYRSYMWGRRVVGIYLTTMLQDSRHFGRAPNQPWQAQRVELDRTWWKVFASWGCLAPLRRTHEDKAIGVGADLEWRRYQRKLLLLLLLLLLPRIGTVALLSNDNHISTLLAVAAVRVHVAVRSAGRGEESFGESMSSWLVSIKLVIGFLYSRSARAKPIYIYR